MAKVSSIQKNLEREKKVAKFEKKRLELKKIISSKETSMDERFLAVIKLASLPRSGAKNRLRNRCSLTGRPRGFYRKFKLSRIALRELGSQGMLPGVRKSSW